MKQWSILYALKFILAFCSIVYELVLAQALSAFLENTVLRYSVTIGLYIFSMGLGALISEGRMLKHPVIVLLRIEILLTLIGGGAIILLHSVDLLHLSRLIFSVLAHILIILIGILTGFELPLLMELRNREKENSENLMLAFDYAGAFTGTIIFAFIFYPKVGLIPTAFIVGFMNAVAGLLLFTQRQKVLETMQKSYYVSLSLQALLLIMIVICLFHVDRINNYFLILYMN